MTIEKMIVQAVYSFKGNNNDELCFQKGDRITVTQVEEGGWWEGTLNGKTGWFPSNYVKEIKDAASNAAAITQQQQYQAVVLKDLIDSEKAHVTELQGLVTNFLQPLEKSTILTPDEYKQMTGNLMEVLDMHQQLLKLLEEEESKPNAEQRVGRLFINWASKIKAVHQAYCSLHPRAVCVLDKYKEEFTKYMESRGAAIPGVLVLTTGLSKPFRRLDKYSGMLQELERHIEESHADRGDTQRSVSVYKDIAATCAATRRQKELELQILTGPVRGWEGQSLSTLGDIIYMGSVAVGPQHHDRYLVLFPTTLLILSVSHRLSAFIYEGNLPLTGIQATRLEDSEQFKNAFEISGPMIEKRIAVCQSKEDANHWVDLLRKHMPRQSTTSTISQRLPSQAEIVPQPPPHLNQRGYSTRSSIINYRYEPSAKYSVILPPNHYPSAAPYAGLTKFYQVLLKQRVIHKLLLKRLLYPEYANKIDLTHVKIRQHRTECVFVKKDSRYRESVINCDSDSDSDSDDSSSSSSSDDNSRDDSRDNKFRAIRDQSHNDSRNHDFFDDDCSGKGHRICRQNAVVESSYDNSSTSSSNPFGYIRYYNPRTGIETETEKRDSDDDILKYDREKYDGERYDGCDGEGYEGERYESFIDYGEVDDVKMAKKRDSKKPSIILTSTARVQLTNQISQTSDSSSILSPKAYLGCEDIPSLDSNTEIKTLNSGDKSKNYVPTTRQSLPTKFVANKFSETSLTTIYVPPWQSSSDNNLVRPKFLQNLSTQNESSIEEDGVEIGVTDGGVTDGEVNDIKVIDREVNDREVIDREVNDREVINREVTCRGVTNNGFTYTRLTDTKRTDARVTDTRLTGTRLTDARLTDARLTDARLTDARLTDARLTDARLTDAGLTDARLTDARFRDTSLPNTELTDTGVSNIGLTGVTNTGLTGVTHPRITSRESTTSSLNKSISITSSSSCSTTHSSSIDLPVNTLPLPDAIIAELLYNFDSDERTLGKSESLESDGTELSSRTVIKPPSMFESDEKPVRGRNHGVTHGTTRDLSHKSTSEIPHGTTHDITQGVPHNIPQGMSHNIPQEMSHRTPHATGHDFDNSPSKRRFSTSLSLENVEFHHPSSDKPRRRRSSIQLNLEDPPTNPMRRCVSYQYLKMSNPPREDPPQEHPKTYCRCCAEPCCSPRSSDSGMAGSCTLNSPDFPNNDIPTARERVSADASVIYRKYCESARLANDSRNVISLTEMEARAFESQCPCTSPFGSTPRTSCQASISENVVVDTQDSARTSVTCSLDSYSLSPHPWEGDYSRDYVEGGSREYVEGGSRDYVEGGSRDYVEGGSRDYVEGSSRNYVERGLRNAVGHGGDYLEGGSIDNVERGCRDYVERGSRDYVERGLRNAVGHIQGHEEHCVEGHIESHREGRLKNHRDEHMENYGEDHMENYGEDNREGLTERHREGHTESHREGHMKCRMNDHNHVSHRGDNGGGASPGGGQCKNHGCRGMSHKYSDLRDVGHSNDFVRDVTHSQSVGSISAVGHSNVYSKGAGHAGDLGHTTSLRYTKELGRGPNLLHNTNLGYGTNLDHSTNMGHNTNLDHTNGRHPTGLDHTSTSHPTNLDHASMSHLAGLDYASVSHPAGLNHASVSNSLCRGHATSTSHSTGKALPSKSCHSVNVYKRFPVPPIKQRCIAEFEPAYKSKSLTCVNETDGVTRDLTSGVRRDLTDGVSRDLTDGITRDLTDGVTGGVTATEKKVGVAKHEIYRSGLYAHWWLKAKIPKEVVMGIYQDTRPQRVQVAGKDVATSVSRERDAKQPEPPGQFYK